MTNSKFSWKLFFKGVGMGIADVVPGVSGGTIALLLGIYERFIESLSQIHPSWFKDFFTFKIKKNPPLLFLLNLGLGILTAVILGARIIHWGFESIPEGMRGLFSGLILASIILLLKKEEKSMSSWFFLLIGGVIAYFLISFKGISFPQNSLGFFFGGSVAILAMLLPGISGSYILLILGLYHKVIYSLKNPFSQEAAISILCFSLGAMMGLLGGSRGIKYLLKNYRHKVIMLLIGFMLGAMPVLWPWQGSEFSISSFTSFFLPIGLGFFSFLATVYIHFRLEIE